MWGKKGEAHTSEPGSSALQLWIRGPQVTLRQAHLWSPLLQEAATSAWAEMEEKAHSLGWEVWLQERNFFDMPLINTP